MRYLVIGMLLLVLAPFAAAQNADPWGRGNLERELQDSHSRQRQQQQNYDQERQQQQRQQQSYEQERQRSYQQEQRYEQEKRQSAEDAVRRERAIQSERRGEPAPGREIYKFGRQ